MYDARACVCVRMGGVRMGGVCVCVDGCARVFCCFFMYLYLLFVGRERKSVIIDRKTREMTAYHEGYECVCARVYVLTCGRVYICLCLFACYIRVCVY